MLILEYTAAPVDTSPADGRADGRAYTGEQRAASAEAEEAIPYLSPVSPLYLPYISPARSVSTVAMNAARQTSLVFELGEAGSGLGLGEVGLGLGLGLGVRARG